MLFAPNADALSPVASALFPTAVDPSPETLLPGKVEHGLPQHRVVGPGNERLQAGRRRVLVEVLRQGRRGDEGELRLAHPRREWEK